MIMCLSNIIYTATKNILHLIQTVRTAAHFRSSPVSRQMDIDGRSLLHPAIEGQIS
jgi:hypothetical protein